MFALPPLAGKIPDSLSGAYAPHREAFDTAEAVGALGAWPKELHGVLFWLCATPLHASVPDADLSADSAFVCAVEINRGRVLRQRGAFVVTKALSEILGVAPLRDRLDLATRAGTDQLLVGAQRLLVGGADGLPYVIRPTLETVGVATFDADLNRPSAESWLSTPDTESVYLVAHDPNGNFEVLTYSATTGQLCAQRLDQRLRRPFHLALSEDRLVVFGATHLQVFDRDLGQAGDDVLPAGELAIAAVLGATEGGDGLEVTLARRRRSGLKIARVTIGESALGVTKVVNTPFASLTPSVCPPSTQPRSIVGIESDASDITTVTSVDLERRAQEQRHLPRDTRAGKPLCVMGARSQKRYVIVPTNHLDGSRQELLLLDAEHIGGPEIATLQVPRHLPLNGQGVFLSNLQLR